MTSGTTRKLKDVDQEVRDLANMLPGIARRLSELERKAADTSVGIAATISADLWPPKDWLRLSVSPWEPGRYFQVCIGPIRLDIFDN